MDTLRAPDKSGLSLDYPQMYLEDRKTAANLVNHVSPTPPPPSAPSMQQQHQLPHRLDPSITDTQSTVLSVRWGFSTVLSFMALSQIAHLRGRFRHNLSISGDRTWLDWL